MKPFQLLIKPASGDCNLACGYCFYRRVTSLYPDVRRRMSADLAEALIQEMLLYRFPETIFSWQGGEPTLMGLDFFSHVVACQMRHGRPGQIIGNALQTNGILLDREWAKFLARYRFLVGLSLDGPQEIHDRYRVSGIDGSGSFDRGMAAAELLASAGVAFNILSVIHHESEDQADTIYRFFRSQGFDHLQFILCLESDPESGEIAGFSATAEGTARFFRELFDLQRAEGPHAASERNLDAHISLHLKRKAGLCALDGTCGDYLVVEHNGDLYPCDFFVKKEWRLGNLAESRLSDFFKHPRMQKFRGKRQMVPGDCVACVLRRSCSGGCLKDRLPRLDGAPGKSFFCNTVRGLHTLTGKAIEEELRKTGSCGREAQHLGSREGRAGRNDPCPCGSGLKYKKCCLQKG